MSKATSYKYLSNKMISIHFPANCCHGNRSKPDTDEILPDIYCDAKIYLLPSRSISGTSLS